MAHRLRKLSARAEGFQKFLDSNDHFDRPFSFMAMKGEPRNQPQQQLEKNMKTPSLTKPIHRSSLRRALLLIAPALVIIAALTAVPAFATPPIGVTTEIFGVATFADIDAYTKTGDWKANIDTKGASDLHVLRNTIVPGGTFGWHSHPGPSLVIVAAGTATFYLGDDPTCTPHVVPTGGTFVDQGHDVHVVRNEGTVNLVTVVVSLIPQGATRRIDEPNPVYCPDIN
jgi:quercetin dioxygenase-like cupin family protein